MCTFIMGKIGSCKTSFCVMKKIGWLMLFMLVGCTSSKPIEAKETRLMVVSDIHYLSNELNDHGEAF